MKTVGLKKNPILWLDGAHLVNDVYTGMLNPIMPFIAAKLSISMAFATVILSMSHICASLLQPLFGFWADNMPKRVFIFWGLIFTSIFISIAPASTEIFILILCIILGSLGSSFFHPQALGLVIKFADSDLAKTMGVFIALGSIGFSLGPLLSAAVAQYWGLLHMPVLCLPGLLVALLMFKLVPKIPVMPSEKQNLKLSEAFIDICRNKKLRILILMSILKTLVTTSCLILLPFLWKSLGYEPFKIGCILFAFIFAGGIGSILSRNLEKKIGTPKVFSISMVSTLPLMVFFAVTYNKVPLLSEILFVIIGFLTMLAQPVMMVMAQSVLPQYKSIMGGFINGFSWGIVAIAMSAIGFIAQANGIIPVLLVIAVIPAVLSVYVIKQLFNNDTEKL